MGAYISGIVSKPKPFQTLSKQLDRCLMCEYAISMLKIPFSVHFYHEKALQVTEKEEHKEKEKGGEGTENEE
jgi:hypothetical protein